MSYSLLRHLAYVLHPLGTKEKRMLMLTSYMDEAGHFDDPAKHYVGMAGFIAPYPLWENFTKVWTGVLQDFDLKEPFHMKDFAHFDKQFKVGWREDKPKREALLGRLISAIQQTDAVPVGAIVSIEDFKTLSKCQQDSFHTPYHVAFQFVTRGAALQALGLEPERVAMVYSYNQEYGATEAKESIDQAGDAQKLWHTMKASTDYGKWMGAYASSTPGEMVPLQAADLLAYELAKEFETINQKTDRPMRWPLQQILKMIDFPNNMIRLLDRKELLRVVKEAGFPCQTATDEVSANQMLSANEYLVKWMCDRGKLPLRPSAFDL